MIRTVVQLTEIAIGLSIASLLGNVFFKVLVSTGFIDTFKNIFHNLGNLLGAQYVYIAYVLFFGAIIIMLGRWLISRSSTNGGSSPNTK